SLDSNGLSRASMADGSGSRQSASASSSRGTGRWRLTTRYTKSRRPWRPGRRDSTRAPSHSTVSEPHIWIRTEAGRADAVTAPSWQYIERRTEQGGPMARLIRCECGFIARGDSDDQVIGVIRGHMSTDHPALLDTVSRDDLAGWIQVE